MITDYRSPITFLPVLLVLLVAGCASPEKRFEQASTAHLRGNYAEAIVQYSKVLRKQPDWPGGAERIRSAGESYWQDANSRIEANLGANDTIGAAEQYVDASRVFGLFSGTGVAAPMPSNFEALASATCRKARQDLLDQADSSMSRGAWRDAEASLRRAERFVRASGDRQLIDEHWLDLRLAQAEKAVADGRARDADNYLRQAESKLQPGTAAANRYQALKNQLADVRVEETVATVRQAVAAGKYRQAWTLADNAEAELGTGHPRAAELAQLRQQALTAGRVRVAFAPYWLAPQVSKQLPPGWLNELSLQADQHHWQQPQSPFIAPQPAANVAEAMRKLDYQRRNLTPEQLTITGQRLGAAYVVYGEITSFATHPQTAATLSLRIVDVAKAKTAHQFNVTAGVAATAPGITARALENELIRKLNDQAAQKVHQTLLAKVP